jgi:hypothetical protein
MAAISKSYILRCVIVASSVTLIVNFLLSTFVSRNHSMIIGVLSGFAGGVVVGTAERRFPGIFSSYKRGTQNVR